MASAPPSHPQLEIQSLALQKDIDSICHESSLKKPPRKLKECCTNINIAARERGLSPTQILQLVKTVVKSNYGVSFKTSLIQCCIPETTFPQNAAIKLVSYVNSLLISEEAVTKIPKSVIRWIVLMLPYMDRLDKLQAIYNMFFYHLRNYELLQDICYILNHLTLYHHVTLFRINELLLLWKRTGNVPPLIGLLVKYKMLRPDLLGVSLPKYQCFFPLKNPKMQKMIQAVQLRRGLEQRELYPESNKTPIRKKAKLVKMIPCVQLSVNDQQTVTDIMPSESFPQILSFHMILKFEDLLKYADQIQLPVQIGSIIVNPLLQYLCTYKKNHHITGQLNSWLFHTCYNAFLETSATEMDYLEDFLSMLVDFTRRVKEGSPAIEYFLYQFLDTWDGFDYFKSILKLIPHFRVHHFADLYPILLDPLKKIFFRRGVYMKCRILIALAELITNHINKWYHLNLLKTMKTSAPDLVTEHEFSLFCGDFDNFLPQVEFNKFIDFVNELCLFGLLSEDNHLFLVHFSLWFQEELLITIQKTGFPLLALPYPEFVCHLIISDQSVAISRLCQIIYDYSCIFIKMKENPIYNLDKSIEQLNVYIQDVCNALWRCKAFATPDQLTESNLFDFNIFSVPGVHRKSVNSSLSIILHQAFLGYAQLFLKKKMPENKNHPSFIRINRHQYFKFLHEQELHGLTKFISHFIDSRLDLQVSS